MRLDRRAGALEIVRHRSVCSKIDQGFDLGPSGKDSWRYRPPNPEPDIVEPVAGVTED
jgi:hypothetical protein